MTFEMFCVIFFDLWAPGAITKSTTIYFVLLGGTQTE